jgi:hypothetical protein
VLGQANVAVAESARGTFSARDGGEQGDFVRVAGANGADAMLADVGGGGDLVEDLGDAGRVVDGGPRIEVALVGALRYHGAIL